MRMLTETVGSSLMNLFTATLENLNSGPPLVFEPYAYESLKTANAKVFGVDGLTSYHMDQADILVSFGADFIETWLSPVEYAWKFKAMHAIKDGSKNLFFQISPCQTLTGANADHWLACKPGSESVIALGLVRQALDIGKGKFLPKSFQEFLDQATAPYSQALVLEQSGIELELYEKLIIQLMDASRPLVLGTGTGAAGPNGLQTNLAVNLLNLLLDPKLELIDFTNRHRVEQAAKRSDILQFFNSLADDSVELLLLNNVNPEFALPPGSSVKQALAAKDLFVVSFSNFMDETAELADLVLPVQMPLETWDEYSGKQLLVSTLQPAMGKMTKASHVADVMLSAAFEDNPPAKNYKDYLITSLAENRGIADEIQWLTTLQQGGKFDLTIKAAKNRKGPRPKNLADILTQKYEPPKSDIALAAMPSIRFFDGRGANRPWLCEIPDPLSRIAWQTPVVLNPKTADANGIHQADIIELQTEFGKVQAAVYVSELVTAGLAGHEYRAGAHSIRQICPRRRG